MSQPVITKALAKESASINLHTTQIFIPSDYTGKQAHVELAERMKQRDAGTQVFSRNCFRRLTLSFRLQALHQPSAIVSPML